MATIPTSIWQPDLISTYFPALGEMSTTALASARARIQSYLLVGWPDVDMRPGSVIGDLVLGPFAHFVVGLETAMGRFMSDLDFEQVASGTIFNCAFVTAFLKNFAVYEQDSLKSTGVIRLLFNADAEVNLDRRLRFAIGTGTFSMRLPFPGQMLIRPVGTAITPATNSLNLVDIGGGVYAVDIHVTGTMGALVTQGDSATLDMTITGLVSAAAVVDFEAGSPETSLPTLATQARERFSASALVTRNASVNYLKREFPELRGVSVTLPGDAEMLRASVNALGIAAPAADIYTKSRSWDFHDTQVIRVPFVTTQGVVSVNRFITPLLVSGNPTLVRSIVSVDAPSVIITPGVECDIYSQSSDSVKAPLLTCAGTALEQLWAVFPMPRNPTTGVALVPLNTEADGSQYANFKITYVHDPLLLPVAQHLDNPDVAPVNVSALVRPFIPIVLSRFEVVYTKRTGMTMTLDAARTEIYNYLRGLSYPDVYSDAKIGDAMLYAGAQDVREISIAGSLQWSAANYVLPATASTPVEDLAAAIADRRAAPSVFAGSAAGLVMSAPFVDPVLGTGSETFATAGSRNITLLLQPSTITFREELR